MTRTKTLAFMVVAGCYQLVAPADNAQAFDRGAAIVVPGNPFASSSNQPVGTLIFSRRSDTREIDFFCMTTGAGWQRNHGDKIQNDIGEMDGDPAATHMDN